MITRNLLRLAFAVSAACAAACSGSTQSDVTSDVDGGVAPAADGGNTPADTGTSPVVDSGTSPAVDAGPAACTTKTYANFGQGVFASKCNACHTLQRPVLTSQAAIRANLSKCRSEIASGAMPQGSRLSAQEKADILEWLNCGAP